MLSHIRVCALPKRSGRLNTLCRFCHASIIAIAFAISGCSNSGTHIVPVLLPQPVEVRDLVDREPGASLARLTVSLTLTPQSVLQGGRAKASVIVRNEGRVASEGNALLVFYRSVDEFINPSLLDSDLDYRFRPSAITAIRSSLSDGYGLDPHLAARFHEQASLSQEEFSDDALQNIATLHAGAVPDPILNIKFIEPLAIGASTDPIDFRIPSTADISDFYYGACIVLDEFHCDSRELVVGSRNSPDLRPVGAPVFDKSVYQNGEHVRVTFNMRNAGGSASSDGRVSLFRRVSGEADQPINIRRPDDTDESGHKWLDIDDSIDPVTNGMPSGGTKSISAVFPVQIPSGTVQDQQYYFSISSVTDEINASNSSPIGSIFVSDRNFIDTDSDRLIEIRNLTMLNNIRYNLSGTSYKTDASSSAGILCGDGRNQPCSGYELTRDLDFSDASSYEGHVVNTAWQPDHTNPNLATNRGWHPIGLEQPPKQRIHAENTMATPFTAVFEGNGYTIRNLYSRNIYDVGGAAYGLFSQVSGVVRNLNLIDSSVYGSDHTDFIGTVVGYLSATGLLLNISVHHGVVDSGNAVKFEPLSRLFSLLGYSTNWSGIEAAKRARSGSAGGFDVVGGLVGSNSGTVAASRAVGIAVTGSHEGRYSDHIGGIVGSNSAAGTIVGNYVTGSVNGGDTEQSLLQSDDIIGGIAGSNFGNIIASYSVSDVNGHGKSDWVGGIVGSVGSFLLTSATDVYLPSTRPSIVSTYAAGIVRSGTYRIPSERTRNIYGEDCTGGIIGNFAWSTVINTSYSFSQIVHPSRYQNSACGGYDGTPLPTGTTIAGLNANNSRWSNIAGGAWVFDSKHGAPVLKYAEYDGQGNIDYCNQIIPNDACSRNRLLPDQPSFDQGDTIQNAAVIATALQPGDDIIIPAKITSSNDNDYFQITVARPGNLTVESIRTDIRIRGALYTVSRASNTFTNPLIEYDDDDGHGMNFQIFRAIPRGTYYIRVYSPVRQIGSYTLRVRMNDA